MISVSDLKNLFKGETIYVIGSGASIDGYASDFFKNKIIVGVNDIHKKINVNFTVVTHQAWFRNALGKTNCVVSEIDPGPDGGNSNLIQSPHKYWAFKVGKYCAFDENLNDVGKEDTFCMGNTISILAMNFAAHLGAATIILAGFDCCLVDGKLSYNGYAPKDVFIQMKTNGTLEQYQHYRNDSFLRNVKEITLMSKKLKEVYGCNVASLSPYFGLKNNAVLLKDYITINDMEQLTQ